LFLSSGGVFLLSSSICLSFFMYHLFGSGPAVKAGQSPHPLQDRIRELLFLQSPFPVIPQCRRFIHSGFVSKTEVILYGDHTEIRRTGLRRPDKPPDTLVQRTVLAVCIGADKPCVKIGRAHVWTPVTFRSRMPSS